MPSDVEHTTKRRPYRSLLAGASAAFGGLVGGALGLFIGFWLASRGSGSPGSEDGFLRILDGLEALLGIFPYALLGAAIGAVLGWMVLPSLLGFVMKWPKVWLALRVQVVAGIALWLTGAFIASVVDIGAIGSWVFAALVVTGPPAAGRWFVDRHHPRTVATDNEPRSIQGPK